MKFFLIPFLALLICFQSFPQTTNKEFRGIWVVTWEYISSSSSVEENKTRIRTILDNMKAANMNAVLWQVRQAGTAYYNSSYEPWGSYAGGGDPGFDPLQYAIEEAHKRGMELHAWFNVFASGSTADGTPAKTHPEWICRDQDGNPMNANIALSPGLPEVRAYTQKVAMEVIRKYDIDGFHLDYIRWNEYSSTSNTEMPESDAPDGFINQSRIDELEANPMSGRYLYDALHPYSGGVPTGYTTWEDFWRGSVTTFVRELQDSIKSEKPWVKLSCAALGNYNWGGWNGYYTVYQDAALWFNQGYVDQISGMHYHWTTGSGFLGMLVNNGSASWGYYIQLGITAGRLFTVGPPSYILAENNVWDRHGEIVNAIRTVPWVDGYQFFSYASWRDHDYFDEAGRTFNLRTTKIRNALASSENVPAPQLQVTKIDPLHYQFTVTPQSVSEPYWFVLYRSKTDNLGRDTSEITKIVFSDSAFTVDQSFTGLQDFNGNYRYAATMLNRYWKESEISNIVQTDPIPSDAPVVTSTTPSEGDTVQINSTITINFSKSINQSNLQNYITLTPSDSITSIYSEPTKIVISTDGLSFNTQYTLTIDPQLKDVNGRLLDGNGDGVEGDQFTLHFWSVDVDTIGPILTASNPIDQDSVDIENVISFSFNEPLLLSSITSNVLLYRENSVVTSAEVVGYNYGTGAVINIKPSGPFWQNYPYKVLLKKEIKDLYNNQMTSDHEINFTAKAEGYDLRTPIDNFGTAEGWEQPGFSGSTTGIMVPGTSWAYSSTIYLPATSPKKAGMLSYKWNPETTPHFLRDYLSGGPARNVTFDTTYIMQVYLFGDGSNSLFRVAIDEGSAGLWPGHEVSNYWKIDWHGWKLLEWNLADPTTIGTWIGNGKLDGTTYRIDSFQMMDQVGSASQGTIYLDNFRVVKKSYAISSNEEEISGPSEFNLYQNYPNPFNPTTIIPFSIDKPGKVTLEVYDILGRKIKTLLSDFVNSGRHEINFNASDLSSGQYIYRIVFEGKQIAKMMILLK